VGDQRRLRGRGPGRWLDLYVTCYVELGNKTGLCAYPGGVTTACSPTEFSPERGTLYRNLGGATLCGRDEGVWAGWRAWQWPGGRVLAIRTATATRTCIWRMTSFPATSISTSMAAEFIDAGTRSGTAFGPDGAPQAGMGVDFGDYDGDGREDLVITTYQREPIQPLP